MKKSVQTLPFKKNPSITPKVRVSSPYYTEKNVEASPKTIPRIPS